MEAPLTAMQNSLVQLAASISTTYTPQGKVLISERFALPQFPNYPTIRVDA